MKLWLLLLALLMINVALAEDNTVYLLDLHYDNGKITINNIKIETGFSPDYKIQFGDYRLEVISFDNKAIYAFNFRAPRLYADKSNERTAEIDGEVIDLEEADFTLIVPYFKGGKDIKIYKENNEVFSTDISEFIIKQSQKRTFTWLYILLAVISVIIIFVLYKTIYKKKKEINK